MWSALCAPEAVLRISLELSCDPRLVRSLGAGRVPVCDGGGFLLGVPFLQQLGTAVPVLLLPFPLLRGSLFCFPLIWQRASQDSQPAAGGRDVLPSLGLFGQRVLLLLGG